MIVCHRHHLLLSQQDVYKRQIQYFVEVSALFSCFCQYHRQMQGYHANVEAVSYTHLLRSYIASRILEGNGYETYNFSGGFRFYDAVVNDRALIERSYACGMDY